MKKINNSVRTSHHCGYIFTDKQTKRQALIYAPCILMAWYKALIIGARFPHPQYCYKVDTMLTDTVYKALDYLIIH